MSGVLSQVDRRKRLASAISCALLLVSWAASPARSSAAVEMDVRSSTASQDPHSHQMVSLDRVGVDASPQSSLPAPPPAGAPTSLIGLGARDLLGEIPPPGTPYRYQPSQTPFEFPQTRPSAPVAIPFPAAVHLFVPGALLAIYASRRFRRR